MESGVYEAHGYKLGLGEDNSESALSTKPGSISGREDDQPTHGTETRPDSYGGSSGEFPNGRKPDAAMPRGAVETTKLEYGRGRGNFRWSGEMRRDRKEHQRRKHSAGPTLTLRDES
ncbi:hypothetical protein Tco_1310149 [Tanacetum coccineum]